MLDFFLLEDTLEKPGAPDSAGLQHIGSMERYDFQRLQDLNLIPQCLDFYNDFRWSNRTVERMYELFFKLEEAKKELIPGAKTAEASFLDMLHLAREKKTGIVAYSK